MKLYTLFISVLFLLCLSCEPKPKEIVSKENSTKSLINYKKGYSVILDSAVYYDTPNRIEIMGKIVNNTQDKVYFPVIQEFPYLGDKGDGYEKQLLKFYGFLVKGYEKGKLVEIPSGIVPMYGFYPPDVEVDLDEIQRRRDTLFYYYPTTNKSKIEQLKKADKPFKNSFNWANRYEYYKKNNFELEPYTVREFNVILESKEYVNPFNNEYSYKAKDFCNQTDSIGLNLISDSAHFKKEILLDKDIEYFKQNNIKIFEGMLESNKVLVKK